MPYGNVNELPQFEVRNNLPKQAREVYMAAYDNAWDQYKDAKDRKGDASREEISHKVAWSAVKKKYKKEKIDK